MDIKVLNGCMLAAWFLVTLGACILNIGWGLVASGAMLCALTLIMARVAGVYQAAGKGD